MKCPVCELKLYGRALLCLACSRSLDRVTARDDTKFALIAWAAKRTRRLLRSAKATNQ